MPVGDGRVRYQLGDGELHRSGVGVSVGKWVMAYGGDIHG